MAVITIIASMNIFQDVIYLSLNPVPETPMMPADL